MSPGALLAFLVSWPLSSRLLASCRFLPLPLTSIRLLPPPGASFHVPSSCSLPSLLVASIHRLPSPPTIPAASHHLPLPPSIHHCLHSPPFACPRLLSPPVASSRFPPPPIAFRHLLSRPTSSCQLPSPPAAFHRLHSPPVASTQLPQPSLALIASASLPTPPIASLRLLSPPTTSPRSFSLLFASSHFPSLRTTSFHFFWQIFIDFLYIFTFSCNK